MTLCATLTYAPMAAMSRTSAPPAPRSAARAPRKRPRAARGTRRVPTQAPAAATAAAVPVTGVAAASAQQQQQEGAGAARVSASTGAAAGAARVAGLVRLHHRHRHHHQPVVRAASAKASGEGCGDVWSRARSRPRHAAVTVAPDATPAPSAAGPAPAPPPVGAESVAPRLHHSAAPSQNRDGNDRSAVREQVQADGVAVGRAWPLQTMRTMPRPTGTFTVRRTARTDYADPPNGGVRQFPRRRASASGAYGPLQDPFRAYMDEISRSDLLDYASVLTLSSSIKAGAVVEATQCAFERENGRKPTLSELTALLKMSPEQVQRTVSAGTVAKNDLVAANLRLVSSIARKMTMSKTSTAGLALDDMIQEGNVGLIRAAEKYDASLGYRFSTYATWWVRASILRAITSQSRTIKLPSSIIEDYQRIRKERERLIASGVGEPDNDVVAAALGMTAAKVRFVLSVVTRSVASLDISLGLAAGGVGARTLAEVIPGDDDVEERMVASMQRVELDQVLRLSLKPTERAAIRLRFGLDDGHPRTLREVGELLSVSKERVRQVIFSALSKLRTPEVRTALVDYLS